MLKNKRGFSLVELTIVMAIIAFLTVFFSFYFVGYLKETKIIKTQADAKVFYEAVATGYSDIQTNGLDSKQKNYLVATTENMSRYLPEEYKQSLITSYKMESLNAYKCGICGESFPAVQIYYPKVSKGKESVWNDVEYPLGIVYEATGTVFTADDYNRKVLKGIGAPDAVLYNDGINRVYSPFSTKVSAQGHYIQYIKDQEKSDFTWKISHDK